jgi:hypothetical protein
MEIEYLERATKERAAEKGTKKRLQSWCKN